MTKLGVICVFCVLVLVNIFAYEHSHGEHHSRQNDHHLKHHDIKARHSVVHNHVKEHHAKERLKQHVHLKHLQLNHRENNNTSEQSGTSEQSNVTSTENISSNEQNNGTSDHDSLVLSLNTSTGTSGVFNRPAGVGFLLSFRAQVVVLINDRRREAVVFDYQSRRGISLTNLSAPNITEYLSNLPSCRDLIRGSGNNVTFNLSSVPTNISKEIQQILKDLYSDYHNFTTFLNATFSLSEVLQHLPKSVSDFQEPVEGDLNSVIDRLRRIGCFLAQIGNRFGNNSVNLGSLLNQNTGFGVFSSIIQQLGGNSSQILEPALHSAETFLSVISALGGNNPFDLFLRAFTQVVHLLSGNSSPQNLIQSLIQLYGHGDNFSSIPQQWASLFRNFISLVQNQTGNTFPGLDVLQQLANRSLTINGTNLSSTFDILRNVNSSLPVETLVEVLFSLSTSLSPQVAIPNLIIQLLSLASNYSTSGNQTLTNLFPNLLHPGSSPLQGGSEILQDFLNLIRDGMKLFRDGASFFASVPVTFLTVILPTINSAVSRSSDGNLSLIPLLRSNIGLQTLQQAAQQFGNFLPGGPSGGPLSIFTAIPSAFLNGASTFTHVASSIGSNIAQAFGNFGHLGSAGKSHGHSHSEGKKLGIH